MCFEKKTHPKHTPAPRGVTSLLVALDDGGDGLEAVADVARQVEVEVSWSAGVLRKTGAEIATSRRLRVLWVTHQSGCYHVSLVATD